VSTNDSGPHAGNIDVILMDRENGMVISGGDDGGGHVSRDSGTTGFPGAESGGSMMGAFHIFSVKCKPPN
jgi:hypothetical protein